MLRFILALYIGYDWYQTNESHEKDANHNRNTAHFNLLLLKLQIMPLPHHPQKTYTAPRVNNQLDNAGTYCDVISNKIQSLPKNQIYAGNINRNIRYKCKNNYPLSLIFFLDKRLGVLVKVEHLTCRILAFKIYKALLDDIFSPQCHNHKSICCTEWQVH